MQADHAMKLKHKQLFHKVACQGSLHLSALFKLAEIPVYKTSLAKVSKYKRSLPPKNVAARAGDPQGGVERVLARATKTQHSTSRVLAMLTKTQNASKPVTAFLTQLHTRPCTYIRAHKSFMPGASPSKMSFSQRY